ncbi:MAG: L-rhamnose mutarotase [Clostridia bacterium]|nr:L-rhamnose mutarotase [Clostridia bacterium]
MKRFCLYAQLKPEKIEEYARLHAEPWPEIMEIIDSCHMHHYSISLRGSEVFTYYEYTGDDYEADMARMETYPIMQEWWSHTRPCFLHHDKGHYYDDLTEVFYKE